MSCVMTIVVVAISDYCRETGQPAPDGPGGYTRAILESLAFKYRFVVESLGHLTGHAISEIQIVGGGSRNRLLNQFTADATGLRDRSPLARTVAREHVNPRGFVAREARRGGQARARLNRRHRDRRRGRTDTGRG